MDIEIIEQGINNFGKIEDFESFENRINKSIKITVEECEREIIDVVFLVKDNRMYAIIKSK
jgi:hypothetical protein